MSKSSIGRITITSVDRLQPGETLSDDKLIGFTVRRQASKAVYGLRGRLNGERVRLTIGWHGRFTPEEARNEAKRLIGILASGVDPRVQRSADMTIADAANQFLLHVRAKRAKGTALNYQRHLEQHLLPRFARKSLNSLTPEALTRLHLHLSNRPVLANRVLDTASSLYAWAARKRLCPPHFNPASKRLVERYKEHPKERFLSLAELKRLGDSLREVEKEGRWSWFAIAAIRLLLLTGCRRDEIRLSAWKQIDWERRLLNLPDSKNGKRSVHLSDGAVDVLKRVKSWSAKGDAFIIRGSGTDKPYANLQDVWVAVRDRANLKDVRLHDLRHSAASFAGAMGASLPVIGALLGHKSPLSTKRYVHVAGDPARAAAVSLGDAIFSHIAPSEATR